MPLAALLATGLASIAGCGGSGAPAPRPSTAPTTSTVPRALTGRPGRAFGITEGNAHLLFPGSADPAPPGFAWARAQLWALHPRYIRVDVDWSKLQRRADEPPRLDAPQDGCSRGRPPCASYAGLHDVLGAIAARRMAGSDVEPVLNFYGVPAWAAHAPGGCESSRTPRAARAVRPEAIAGYRALVADVLALARRLGLAVRYLSPWNEPNAPGFLSPQRSRCLAGTPPQAGAQVYASLARAMRDVLRADGGEHRLVLGELARVRQSGPFASTISEFVTALPADVVCAAGVWSVHAYPSLRRPVPDAVAQLERALDRRAGCTRRVPIWVTETGAPNRPAGAPGFEVARGRKGCRALAAMLDRWDRDPRVQATFQYSFRQDPAFPVGLAGTALKRLSWAYYLWRARAVTPGEAGEPALWAGCAA